MAVRNMNPKGSLFGLFQSERKRLHEETALESIFYSDKHHSLQYRISTPEQKGVLTVIFSEDCNEFYWRDAEKTTKSKGLGKYLGCIEPIAEKNYINMVFLRSEAMNQVPVLVNDYHTSREKIGLFGEKTDRHCIENLEEE